MQKEVLLKSALPYYGVGLSWLLYSFIFPLYRLSDILLCTAVSVGVFFVLRKLAPGKKVMVEVVEKTVQSGNAQVDQMIAEGKGYIAAIRQANKGIEDAGVSAQIDRLEEISSKIFKHIAENPRKATEIRKFLNYYLPTVLKLLNSYDKLAQQTVKGDNIKFTMKRIEEIMETVVKAFENQLDRLFQDEALDISTDITVLEGMLAQEGLAGKDFLANDKTILKL